MSKTIGVRHYGRTPLNVAPADRAAWNAQDSSKTWTDGGEIRAAIEPIIKQLEAVASQQATLGASEYLAEGECSLAIAPGGEVLLGVRVHNDDAALIAHVPLRMVVLAALNDLRPRLGVDPQAQTLLSQLVAIGRQLSTLGQPAQPPAEQPKDTAAA